MALTITTEVQDARGKTYKLVLDPDGGVTIRPPASLKLAAIPIEELSAAIRDMEEARG